MVYFVVFVKMMRGFIEFYGKKRRKEKKDRR